MPAAFRAVLAEVGNPETPDRAILPCTSSSRSVNVRKEPHTLFLFCRTLPLVVSIAALRLADKTHPGNTHGHANRQRPSAKSRRQRGCLGTLNTPSATRPRKSRKNAAPASLWCLTLHRRTSPAIRRTNSPTSNIPPPSKKPAKPSRIERGRLGTNGLDQETNSAAPPGQDSAQLSPRYWISFQFQIQPEYFPASPKSSSTNSLPITQPAPTDASQNHPTTNCSATRPASSWGNYLTM